MSDSAPPDGTDRNATRVGVADTGDVLRRASASIQRPLCDLAPLPGGTSSLTYVATQDNGEPVVVKVAPRQSLVRNRDVLRQAWVLTALAGAEAIAVPAVLGTDAGNPPEVPPLFVTTYVEGESYEPRHTVDGVRPEAAEVLARAQGAATMLAALHSVAPAAVGLDEPATTLAAEVERWRKAFDTCELAAQTRLLEQACYQILVDTQPEQLEPAVLHGDWRLGNMRCVGPDIRAVIDWANWSIGDPRMDLAWMRLMSDPDHPTADATHAPTLEPDELLAAYERAAGREVPGLAWFDALVRYKQAAASALLVEEADRRGDAGPVVERMRSGTGLLLYAARGRLATTPASRRQPPAPRLPTGATILDFRSNRSRSRSTG